MLSCACRCCGNRTLSEPPGGNYEICPVCYWEDDAVQAEDPSYEGGANAVSLNQARANYASFGASDLATRSLVRPATPAERVQPT